MKLWSKVCSHCALRAHRISWMIQKVKIVKPFIYSLKIQSRFYHTAHPFFSLFSSSSSSSSNAYSFIVYTLYTNPYKTSIYSHKLLCETPQFACFKCTFEFLVEIIDIYTFFLSFAAMASIEILSPLRPRRSTPVETFLAPIDLPSAGLLENLHAVSRELISSFSVENSMLPFFQRKNSRSLIRKIQVLSVILDSFGEIQLSKITSTVLLCFKELYILLCRSKILLGYIKSSGKLWLLLQNQSISGQFHDLNQEISAVLDVFPLNEVNISKDVKEQVELLREQSRKSNLMIDKHDESLRLKFYYFLSEFENGRVPDPNELRSFMVDKLAVCDSKTCRFETEFLEEQIVNHEGDTDPTFSIFNGFVALIRYCWFLLFRFEDEEDEFEMWKHKENNNGLITQEIADTFVTIPKDFCCPISLDLMRDPVVVSTGQTYDRESISRWMDGGFCTCPKTGQMLVHTQLVPNRVLKNLITRWCMAHGISYDPLDNQGSSSELRAAGSPSKAAMEASKATASLLVHQLANGTQRAKTLAAMEIRLLSKTGMENRVCIAEAGAIPHLKTLLTSPDAIAQENSVTALLNLSIYDKNKSEIMNIDGCLGLIARVLRFGHTVEARENAAATLFSLSAVHEYKKRIAEEEGALEALSALLKDGTPRGKKDAVTALFNLSTHTENCARMIKSGAVTALVKALGNEGVSEEAAGALTIIVRQPFGAEAVGNEQMAVPGLIGMMQFGTPRGKENAVAALLELCRNGGAAAMERVLKAPMFARLLQNLLYTGTKRARRKAASLARVFQRSENSSHFGGMGVGYAYAGNSAADRDTGFAGDVPMPLSISVPVL